MIEKFSFKGKTYILKDWVTLSIFGLQVLIGGAAFTAFMFIFSLFVK